MMRTDYRPDRARCPGAPTSASWSSRSAAPATPVLLRRSHGDLARLRASTGLAAYRIVQEALTNVVRHAAGSATDVRVDVTDREARRSMVRQRPVAPTSYAVGDGPPRACVNAPRAVGGRLTAGPHDGGWRVEAVLPA